MALTWLKIENAVQDVICPLCQIHVIDFSAEEYIQPCEHTSFIALDLGFEFITDHFESTLERSVDDIHQLELNVLEELKKSSQWSKLTVYQMPLGAFDYSRYIGFLL